MTRQHKKTSYWSNFKNFKTLTKKERSSFINLNILIFSLLIVIPLLIAHIVLMFAKTHNGHAIGDPIWFQWFMMCLISVVIWTCGLSYYKRGIKEIFKWHRPGMATLVMVSSLIAYLYSFYPLILNTVNFAWNQNHPGANLDIHTISFFASAGMIVTIIKFGDTITENMKMRTNDDLEAISSLQVEEALRYDEVSKKTFEVSTKEIKVGDLLMVKKGGRFPVDGIIVSGSTEADESMLTGESKPIEKRENDGVIGSTNNLTNTVIIKATVVGRNTVLNTIVNNVKKIAGQKPRYQKIADTVALWLVPFVIALAILAFILWAIPGVMDNVHHSFTEWLNNSSLPGAGHEMTKAEQLHSAKHWSLAVFYGVSVLCVACPCALGLAVPLATLVGASKAARNGIIINRAEAYEKVKKIDAIAFDKTGTLTEGKFTVSNILGDLENLSMMQSLEKLSIHPLAKAFNDHIDEKYPDMLLPELTNVTEIPGVGLEVKTEESGTETLYQMTSLKFVLSEGYEMEPEIQEYIDNFNKQKEINVMQSITCFSINKKVVNLIVFEDQIRPEAFDVIKILKHRNIDVYMISGDNEIAVKYVADQLGIEHYYYDVKPSEKQGIIESIQQKGKSVAYVGDGINDLEALKQSDLSIAINKENSIANAVSDVLILNKEVMSILKTVTLTKITRKMILFNLIWTFVYNLITLPLTIVGFIPAFIAVFIMAASDISVLSNTLFFKLRKYRFISKKEMKELELHTNIDPYL
ncbi:heavy metal translocating P-type ATPase [Ureaplasma ceti]|uniref:Copper-translocating P-type ATPase n=1 Tax=Ureaplasma ceti TaxID=3119530 RepID=A0ABP9U7J9_9BACT